MSTAPALMSLLEVVDLALEECKGYTNNENYPEVLALPETGDMLRRQGLCDFIGRRRKNKTPVEEAYSSKNLCLDFGLPEIPLDSEIAIPLDLDNVLGGCNTWKEPDAATLNDIDAHILLLESQALANLAKAKDWKRVRQAAAHYANGNLDLTLSELRQVATGVRQRVNKEEK